MTGLRDKPRPAATRTRSGRVVARVRLRASDLRTREGGKYPSDAGEGLGGGGKNLGTLGGVGKASRDGPVGAHLKKHPKMRRNCDI